MLACAAPAAAPELGSRTHAPAHTPQPWLCFVLHTRKNCWGRCEQTASTQVRDAACNQHILPPSKLQLCTHARFTTHFLRRVCTAPLASTAKACDTEGAAGSVGALSEGGGMMCSCPARSHTLLLAVSGFNQRGRE